MIKTKKQMFLVIGVFAVVMLLGTVSYAFFNYTTTGVLKACNFLFEGTKYADSSKVTYGPWLETPLANDAGVVWGVTSGSRVVGYNSAFSTNRGVRPTIDVPYSLMAY